MPIPAIPSYEMPTSGWRCQVTWKPARERAALLIHDMQNHFLKPFPQASAPLADLMSNLVALREACSEADIPILFTGQPGQQTPDQRGLLADFWGPGIGAKPADAAITTPLTPRPHEHVIIKRRYSAFHGTGLAEVLTELGRDQLIICGIYAHIGVQATATDAFMHDIQPFVPADAVADFDRHHHDTALRHIAGRLGQVALTRDLIAAVRTPVATRA